MSTDLLVYPFQSYVGIMDLAQEKKMKISGKKKFSEGYGARMKGKTT